MATMQSYKRKAANYFAREKEDLSYRKKLVVISMNPEVCRMGVARLVRDISIGKEHC